MAPVAGTLILAALCLLLVIPPCLHACPRSCSCPSPKEVHCTFRHFPSTPQNLPDNTERLNLGYNSITTVMSSDFQNLRQLEMLMLHGNEISSVSSGSFYQLRSLQILKMSYNKLTKIDPSMFDGLTNLVRLHLDHNLIDFIEPFAFNGLTSLKLLQLEGNLLQDLHPHTFITVSVLGTFWSSGLRHLHLADNKIEYLLPGTLQHLEKLEVLSLHGNPWTCDCQLHWLLEWEKNHQGVIKCKKDRESDIGSCAACASPPTLNNSQIFQISTNQFNCDRPSIQSPLKIGESSIWEDQEPDTPHLKDLETPLGHLTFILSDSHGNRANVACDVTRPTEDTSLNWEPVRKSDKIVVNVTVRTLLECEIDRDALQHMWRLIAYYYESPAILDRGIAIGNYSKATFQYAQATNEDSPYFTELKGHLMSEPAWLLQPRVTLQLNRRKTTTKKLVLNFSTSISKVISGRGDEEDMVSSWAWIQRGNPNRIQSVLEHSEVNLDCDVHSSGHQTLGWMLPDLTTVDETDSDKVKLEMNKLVVKNASISDSGLYHCFVKTNTHVDIASYRLAVRVKLLSPSDLNGKKISVENGESFTLYCNTTSLHPVTTKWYLPSGQILQAPGKYGRVYISKNNTLIIKKVTLDDAGEYSCLAANLYGVDMLSHLVVVTTEQDKEKSVVTLSKTEIPLFQTEDDEGSGYKEIKRPTDQLIPRRHNDKNVFLQNEKGKKTKTSVKKLNQSWKEVTPVPFTPIHEKANVKVPQTPTTTNEETSFYEMVTLATIFPTEYVKVSKPRSENRNPKLSSRTLEHPNSTTVPNETQPEKEDKQTLSSFWNQRRKFTFRQRRPPLRRVRPNSNFNQNLPNSQRPTPTQDSTSVDKLKQTSMQTMIPEVVSHVTTPGVLTAHHLAENPLKVPNLTLVKDNLQHFEWKIKPHTSIPHAITPPLKIPEFLATVAPKLIDKFGLDNRKSTLKTNSQTNDDKSLANRSNVQTVVIIHPTAKIPLATEKPTLTNVDVPRVYNFNLQQPGVLDAPWLIPNYVPKKQFSTTHRAYTQSPFRMNKHGIPAWPTANSRQSSQDRTWYFLQTGNRGVGVTNRPEITAETAKPTATYFLKTMAPNIGSSSHVRDHVLFNKLRQRYRQSQLEAYRLAMQGKVNTSKARTYHPTPQPHYKTVAVPSSPVHSNTPHSTTASYGSTWNQGHLEVQPLSTGIPFPNLMGRGVKPRITTTDLVTVSALAETDVLLSCSTSGDPKPVISWTKISTGATMQSNTKHGQRFEVFSNGTFVIRNTQLQDRGQYLCIAQNKYGSDRRVVTLVVQTQPPKILTVGPRDVSVHLGNSASLDCVAKGKPEAQISWILPDRTFVRDVATIDHRVSLLPNGTLSIHSAQLSFKGYYKCIASNAVGADTLTYNVHVAALLPIIAEISHESKVVNVGRSVFVHCTANGEPLPLIKWVLPDGSEMKPTQFISKRLFVFPNGTIYIKNITPTDSGRYECSASNTAGIARRTVQMDVRQEPPGPWKGLYQQHSVKATYGSTVFLHCPESIGSNRGTVWRLPSKVMLEPHYSRQRPITAFPNGTLRILRLTEKDRGNYLCLYQRPNGEDMELFQVEVLTRPPKIENTGAQYKRVANGDNILVDCVASGLPDPEVSWSLPDGTMINNALQSDDSGTRNRRYVIFGNGTLLMQQMEKKDEGNYTCYAKNTLGEDAMKVSVQVTSNSPQMHLNDQLTISAPFGQSAYMKCDATSIPTHTVIWISPRNEIITSSSVKYQIQNDGTLIINKLTLADQGTYACVTRNPAGDNIKNVKLLIEVKEPQINGQSGRSERKTLVVQYTTILLDCKTQGIPEPNVYWITPNGISLPTSYSGGRFQVHINGSLEIRGIRKADEGRFLCTAKNYMGEASLAIDLQVTSLAEKPSFLLPNVQVFSLKPDGEDIFLECSATGKPNPEFLWVLPNGTALNTGMRLQRFIHFLGNGTLHIIQPGISDKGVYRCLAKNVAGQAEKRYSLETGQKPQIRGRGAPLKISFGHTLTMPCSVDGWPQAAITWTLPNGMTLNTPRVLGRIAYFSNGTLQVKETGKFDRGTYTCKASNTFGSSTLSYPVSIIVFPPQITHFPPSATKIHKGSSVILNCVAAGVPKPEISWTLPGRTTLVSNNRFSPQGGVHMTEEGHLVIPDPHLMNSGIYKCNARNALGTDFKATYLQVI